jgi:hypothetical protein
MSAARTSCGIRLVIEDSVARGEPLPSYEPPRIREVTVTLAT